MQYRKFGKTGWDVSEIAFGAWQIGGDWGKVDDKASIETLLYAFEKGINFVDTAELYGRGHSEEVIGEALRQWRGGKVYVATKAQPIIWPDPTQDNPPMRGRYPAWYLRDNVEKSLKRLGVERLDLFQLHCWLRDGLVSLDWLETLNDLRREGKIDHVGVSIRDFRPDEGVELARFGLVDSIQVVFNMFEQRPADDLFHAGEASRTAFIARVPLDSGSLIGHWTKDSYATFEPGSQPHSMFRGERFMETFQSCCSTEGALQALLSDTGGGSDALCAFCASAFNAHTRHEEQGRSGHEHRLLRRRAISGRAQDCARPARLIRNYYH